MTETKTKDGYEPLMGYAYEGNLPENQDYIVTIRVVNAESFRLPETGSHSLALMPLSVILCLGICAGAIVLLRKKES